MKRILLINLTALTLGLAACGGGGGDNSTPQPPPSSAVQPKLSVGPINGFGSVVVNGIKFDDNGARIEIEDNEDRIGDDNGGLRVGMLVQVSGKVEDNGTRRVGKAERIEMEAEIRGPIKNLVAATTGTGGSFSSMGVNVKADDRTALFGIAKLGDLKSGDVVQVHGQRNDDGSVSALLVQRRPSADSYKSTGIISNHNSGAKSFNIGTMTVLYSSSTELRRLSSGLSDGMLVRVQGRSSGFDDSANSLQASRIKSSSIFDDSSSFNESEVRGLVSGLSADKSSFKLNGVTVNVSASTQFLRGTKDQLANGSNVEVEGSVSNGVLQARKVKYEDSSSTGQSEFEMEFTGTVSALVASGSDFTFTARGQKVRTTSSTEFRLRSGPLANGMLVEVKGLQLVDGVLTATRVKQED
jgi:Domain of unknown function (DUF5666)